MRAERCGQTVYMPLHDVPSPEQTLPVTYRQTLQDFADGIYMQQSANEQATSPSSIRMRLLRTRELLGAKTNLQAAALAWTSGIITADHPRPTSPVSGPTQALNYLSLRANGVDSLDIATVYAVTPTAITNSIRRLSYVYDVESIPELLMHALEYGDIQSTQTAEGKLFFHQKKWPVGGPTSTQPASVLV